MNEIDIVYTWVNRYDTAWKHQFKLWLNHDNNSANANINTDPNKITDVRFNDCQELRYSLRSATKYAQFRNIYLVISDITQIPDWLNAEHPKLKIITHKDIFPPEYVNSLLPCFNSISIELHLHRIVGLSDYYLYLNDDTFFGNHVEMSDFINKNGQTIMYLDRHKPIVSKKIRKNNNYFKYNFTDTVNYTNKMLDTLFHIVKNRSNNQRYVVQHLPYIHQKSVDIEIYNLLHEHNLYFQTCTRFRTNTNIAVQSFFYPYYSFYTGKSVLTFDKLGQKISHDHYLYYKKILQQRPKMFCLNKLMKVDQSLMNFYEKMYGHTCD